MNNKGETLIETLVSLLIITIVITGFSEVIASVTRANNSIKNKRTTFNKETLSNDTKDNSTWVIVVNRNGNDYQYNQSKINKYIDENGFYYYEYQK